MKGDEGMESVEAEIEVQGWATVALVAEGDSTSA